jgi:hypothetical protein
MKRMPTPRWVARLGLAIPLLVPVGVLIAQAPARTTQSSKCNRQAGRQTGGSL